MMVAVSLRPWPKTRDVALILRMPGRSARIVGNGLLNFLRSPFTVDVEVVQETLRYRRTRRGSSGGKSAE